MKQRKLRGRTILVILSTFLLPIFWGTPTRGQFNLEAGLPSFLKMKLLATAAAVLSFASTIICAEQGNLTKPLTSRLILPSNFKPPQNFKNLNLVHIINLEKSYPKEQINVLIENTAKTAQDEYFIPFTSQQMETIGGLEVKDRKDPDAGLFEVEAVEFDTERYVEIWMQLNLSS